LPYSSYYNALVADSKTTNDTVALAHVIGGSSNPVNGGANITAALPLLRALGFTVNPPGDHDSTISLNMSLINLTRPPADPGKYDLQAVVTHEMDEVLGTSSGMGGANIHPVDLFRYTAAGARTFTTSADDAYFSIDGGTTLLARYNQNASGDYGDWWSILAHTPVRVQDAFGTPGSVADLGVELTVLDAVGWDLVSALPVEAPVLQPVTLSGTNITLAWSSVAGRIYQVQYKTNLTQAAWKNLGSSIAASGTTTSTTDSIHPDLCRFYHVALLPPPPAPPTGSLSATDPAKVITGPFELVKHVLNPSGANPSSISMAAPQRRAIHSTLTDQAAPR
jgi:hypothetical protein